GRQRGHRRARAFRHRAHRHAAHTRQDLEGRDGRQEIRRRRPMYPASFDYHTPGSVQEAISLLGKLRDDAKLLAGGHSLIPMMKLRLAQPKHVIDLRKVPGLSGIKEDGGMISIGARTTHYLLASSMLLHSRCPVVSEAAATIGDPQVRNLGTIGEIGRASRRARG